MRDLLRKDKIDNVFNANKMIVNISLRNDHNPDLQTLKQKMMNMLLLLVLVTTMVCWFHEFMLLSRKNINDYNNFILRWRRTIQWNYDLPKYPYHRICAWKCISYSVLFTFMGLVPSTFPIVRGNYWMISRFFLKFSY